MMYQHSVVAKPKRGMQFNTTDLAATIFKSVGEVRSVQGGAAEIWDGLGGEPFTKPVKRVWLMEQQYLGGYGID